MIIVWLAFVVTMFCLAGAVARWKAAPRRLTPARVLELEQTVLSSYSEPPEPFELAVQRRIEQRKKSDAQWAMHAGILALGGKTNYLEDGYKPGDMVVYDSSYTQVQRNPFKANEAVLVKRALGVIRDAG